MTHSPELTAAGRAIAEVRGRYWVGDRDGSWFVFQDADDPAFAGLGRDECQAWIDCEAACAAFESVLPGLDDNDVLHHAVMSVAGPFGRASFTDEFTAAIRAILGRDGT